MGISEWVSHSIRCMGPCQKTYSYDKFRIEDLLKPKDEMEGLLACSHCHDQDFKTYITQEILDEFNERCGTTYKNGDVFRAVMFQVVSQERHAELQELSEGDTMPELQDYRES